MEIRAVRMPPNSPKSSVKLLSTAGFCTVFKTRGAPAACETSSSPDSAHGANARRFAENIDIVNVRAAAYE